MINFLSQNELCYSIFSIKLDDHLQFSSLRPKLQELVPKGKFPIINFKKYQNDYKNGVDFYILLKKYSFSFPFNKEFLEGLSKQEKQAVNEMTTSPDYIVIIVLHSFITWYINFIQNHSISDILILLRSLLIIMNIKNCKVVSKSRFYAASAFMNVYSEIVESTYITNIIDILPPIVEFLTMNNDLPQNSFDLLLKLGNRVIDSTSTKFTKEMSHFVNFVVIIIRTCGSRCPSYITSAIVSLMSKSLIGLDKDALSFFGRSIKTLGIETAFPIVSELPKSIMNKIIENPTPLFECNSITIDAGLVFPSNKVIFENKLVTFPTFETDIRKLIKIPPYFPDIVPPNVLISHDILEIFELIYKIVENEEKLKEILIQEICSLLSSCPISSHYYDINAAFLYFLYVLSKETKINILPKDIFMSNVFCQKETIFNHGEDFQKINTIRHLAFLLLINQTPEIIFNSLLTIMLKPYTFAELVYRLLPDMNSLTKLLEISTPVFEGVMTAIVFYQKFQNYSEELKSASSEARIAGFTYIDIMLKIPDFRKKFFESSLCVDAIISLVFEKRVRNWTLLRIIDAFYLENTSINYLIESCLKLFQISCKFGFTKDEIHHLESLIRFLDHEVFNSTNRIELLRWIEPVISGICIWIAGLIKHASKPSKIIKQSSNSAVSSPVRINPSFNTDSKTPPKHRPIPHFHENLIKSRINTNTNNNQNTTNDSRILNESSNKNEKNQHQTRPFHRRLKSKDDKDACVVDNLKRKAPSSSPSTPRRPIPPSMNLNSRNNQSCSPSTPRVGSTQLKFSSSSSTDTDSTPKTQSSFRSPATPVFNNRIDSSSDSSQDFEMTPKQQIHSNSNNQSNTKSEPSPRLIRNEKEKDLSNSNNQSNAKSEPSPKLIRNEKEKDISNSEKQNSSNSKVNNKSDESNSSSTYSSNISLSNNSQSKDINSNSSSSQNINLDSHSKSPKRIRRRRSKTKINPQSMPNSKQDQSPSSYSSPSSPFFPKAHSLSQSNGELNQNEFLDSSPTNNADTNFHSNSTPDMKIKTNSESNQTPELSKNSRAYYIHLLNKLMNILTRFSAVHTLSQSDISLIDTTANFLYKNEPSEEFFKQLIYSIAGEFLQTTEPSFDIKQPKAMKLMITLFNRSQKLLSKIDYIVSLCNYSTKNCEQLQKGEFDLFLVGRLFNLRNNEEIKEEVFKRALLILRLISAHSCSVSFVHQYVSLFCPIDCKVIPRFHQEVLDSMQILLQNSGKVPATPLPIFSTTKVSAKNVKLNEAFTIFFWFFIYSNKEPVTIVEIENEGQKFSIQFNREKISIFFQVRLEQWNCNPTFDLPLNQWSLATFSFKPDKQNNKTNVNIAVNGNILPLSIFPYFDLSNNFSKADVGITKNDKLSVMLGSFGITKYFDSSHNISLFDAGPRRIPRDPYFFFISHNKNDNYEIEVIPSTVEATIQTVRSLHKPSFTDILIEICGVSILVPILANTDLSYKNGKKLPFLLEQFIQILEMSLTLSYNSQRLFASEKSFLIISNILLSSKHFKLNYRVFFRFCSLFELLENEKCRSQLLFGILLKFDLWIRCDASNLKRILRYWDFSLVPQHLSFVMQKIKFIDIIAALRIFFWYDPVENEIILHSNSRLIYKIDDIRTCREHLFSIALMMTTNGITSQDIKFIISQILSLEDKEQTLDLLNFVNTIIDNYESITKKSEDVMESIIYLMFLYTTDLNILELTINIIIKTYHHSLIKETNLVKHFELMIHELPGSYAYHPTLTKLIEICQKKEPKLFSLCSMIAFSLGKGTLITLLDILKPNALYCSTPSWSLWAVVSLFKIDDAEYQERLISFLIDISPQQWKNIFWTIDSVGRALQIDQELLKKKFITELGNYLLKFNDYDEMFLRHYFTLIPQFLFLHSYMQHNEYLKTLYHKSFKKKKVIISSANQSPNIQKNDDHNNVDKEKNESKQASENDDSSCFGDFVTPVRPRPPIPQNYQPRIRKSRASQMTYGKRSSFRSFDNLNFNESKEKFMKLDFIKFKIEDFISMFKNVIEKDNYKIYFGLKISAENVWEDIDIARIANKLFRKFPAQIYYDSCLFINAFMLHYDPEDALKTINVIKANNTQIISFECSLYNKHADNLHYQKIFDEQPSSYQQKSYQVLQQFESMYHENKSFTDIYTNLTKNEEKAKKLYFNYEIDVSQLSIEIIGDFKEDLNLKNTKYSKFWTQFWRAMTIGRAPWRQSLSEDQKKNDIYFKRDFVLCASMCPYRMRPNYQFNIHEEASRKRDKGLESDTNENMPLGKSGTLISLLSSQSSFNMTKSLFSISNTNLLESTTDFNIEQNHFFNTADQLESSSDILKEPISENSKCVFESTCDIITVSHQYEALFSLQKDCVVITKSAHSARVIKSDNIEAVFQRTVLHRETAIEIFLDDGLSFFVNFPEVKSSEIIKEFKVLKKSSRNPLFLQMQPPKQFTAFSKCTNLWQNKKITNFEYLMILNTFSGRSFNDPSQYPFLPWILSDYKSETIDLKNPEIYRDLSTPVGALGKEKFEKLKHSMESLPYLYSSGNVSPLIVFLWLVRVEPFTTLQIKEQDNSFDHPDRQFKSIEGAYHSVLTLSSDFRELIPEFFFQPEFLVNMNNFDLGISDGKRVNDVELPKWIKSDSDHPIVSAYEFIYMHRKALESDHVSSHLNEWIDLIWGDKSRGEKAIESNNVYSPEMYPEIWESESELGLDDNATTIEAIKNYVGQIPIQLFDKPHPQRCCSVDKNNLDNVLNYKLRNQNGKICIGTIIFLNDMKTVVILTIDENGVCIENDVDINYLQKTYTHSQDDSEISPTISNQSTPYAQTRNNLINRSSSQKYVSLLNLSESSPRSNKSYQNSIDSDQIYYQNIEKGSSHFDPSTFKQTIWKPAFLSSSPSTSKSLFEICNGSSMPVNQGQKSSLNSGIASISLWKKFFIVDSYQKSDIYLVDPKSGQSERVVRQRNDITAISTDGCKWLAVANKDSKIYLYSLDGTYKTNSKEDPYFDLGQKYLLKVQFSIPSFRDYVKCCDISTSFHCLVCGTRDNSLMICSMTSHSIVKIVELDAKPILLAITPSWGFTVVYMRSISEGKSAHFIAVFGTNGYLLKKVEIRNAIKKIVAWKDDKGFDFVLLADNQNRIFAFEAFYCKIGKPIFETSSNIIDLSYMECYQAAVALCEDGMTYFIPISQ